MRQLTVVAISDDGTHVLLAGGADATKPTHQVLIDDRLAAAVRGELDTGPRRESALSPKEIQSRLRAGDTPEQVAKAANIPVSRVLRFFGPVASERDRILTQAQAATMRRTRGPAATLSLGEAVERRLATATGLKRESVEWSAKRRDDGAWVVALTYTARGGQRSAAWLWQPAVHDLTALDANATKIALEESPPTPHLPVPNAPAAGSRRVALATPSGAAPTKRTAKPARRAKTAARKPATSKPVKVAAAAEGVVPEPIRSPRVRREPQVIPPPPARSGRVPVPSWDDVLFGAAHTPAEDPSGNNATGNKATGDAAAGTPKPRRSNPAPARGRRRS